jgi:hypothetical protein
MTLRFTLAQRLGLRIRAVPELLGCRDNATPCFLGDSMLPIERKARSGNGHIGNPGHIANADCAAGSDPVHCHDLPDGKAVPSVQCGAADIRRGDA